MKIQYSIFILLFLISCTAKTGKINQYAKDNNSVRQRNGNWEEKYASDIGELIGKGKYKNGQKVGLWVTKYQDKVYQKERFKKNISKVKIYHKNGVLREKGQTKTNENDTQMHWFYDGAWKIYDENGKHIYTKIYKQGTPLDSIPAK